MNQKTIIFIGPQGSGKGTQGRMVAGWIEADGDGVIHYDTGDGFRGVIKTESYTAECIGQTLEQGDVQPTFLAANFWGQELINNITADDSLVFDGSPRRVLEARLMDEAFTFYNREHVDIFHLKISREESIERLLDRGRHDDTEKAIKHRLDQYEDITVPTLNFFSERDIYTVHDIDGEQGVEEVFADIKEALQ